MEESDKRDILKKIKEILKRELGEFPEICFAIRDDTRKPRQIIAELTASALLAGIQDLTDGALGEFFNFEKQVNDLKEEIKAYEKAGKAKDQELSDLQKDFDDIFARCEVMIKSKAELRLSKEEELERVSERAKKMETAIKVVTAVCASLRPNNKKSDFIAKLEDVKNILSNI